MSQPSSPIPGTLMPGLDTPLKASKSNPDTGTKGRVSQLFTKMVTTVDSPRSPMPAHPAPQNAKGRREEMKVRILRDDEKGTSEQGTKARKRLSKKPTNRFSTPPTLVGRAASETITPLKKSRFSLSVLPSQGASNTLSSHSKAPTEPPPLKSILKNRNSLQPPQPTSSPASSSTSTRVSSLQSSRTSSTSSISTAPSSVRLPSPPRIQSQSSRDYNPLENYVPCMAANCDQHYLLTALGPTFYSTQAPYHLHRKQGLCPTHAFHDLKHGNAGCKRTYETMRQNAGRKTLAKIASEFELYIKVYDAEREENSKELARAQAKTVFGYGGPQVVKKRGEEDQWDWRYTLRPCTGKGCKRDMYSPYSAQLYNFYHRPRRSTLSPQPHFCIVCAKSEVQECEGLMKQRRDEFDDETWVIWLGEIRETRRKEKEFWERAQERVVRETGPSKKWVEEEVKEEELVKGKSADTMREMCVVM